MLLARVKEKRAREEDECARRSNAEVRAGRICNLK